MSKIRKGQKITYRQGRGYSVGRVVSVDSSAGKVTLKNERTGKEVTRNLESLADGEDEEPAAVIAPNPIAALASASDLPREETLVSPPDDTDSDDFWEDHEDDDFDEGDDDEDVY